MESPQRYGGKSQTLEANSTRVSELVGMAAGDMERTISGEKVPLSDMVRVRKIGAEYLVECSKDGVLPTVRGCAARLGVTRNALYDTVKRHPDGEFARWLEDFSDMCGELCMTAALEGAVAAIPAIFTVKARYQWREAPAQLEIGSIKPLGYYNGDAEAVAAKYAELPE